MKNSLLAHIASRFVTQYENVANSSICYLLNTYPSARKALGRIAGRNEVPSRFRTELSAGENGRPDVTGINERGQKLMIIEGKFWASLMANQPDNYLAELALGGQVIFFVPERRQSSLTSELSSRGATQTIDSRVVISTWTQFIDAVEDENGTLTDHSLTSDLAQLRSLCDQMDVEGMPPLSESDLDPMNGRISYQLAELIDECRSSLSRWEPVDLRGMRASGWKLGYGFYFVAYGLGCQLFYSSYHWFTKKSATPFWLTIKAEGFKKSESILNTLHHWDPTHTYDEDGVAMFAIRIRPGMDRLGTVQHIVDTVKLAIEQVVSAGLTNLTAPRVIDESDAPLSPTN